MKGKFAFLHLFVAKHLNRTSMGVAFLRMVARLTKFAKFESLKKFALYGTFLFFHFHSTSALLLFFPFVTLSTLS